MWISAPSTSQLISMPGTIASGGWRAASSSASARPLVESWSVTASTLSPRRAASCTSSRGVKLPSDAVVWAWRSTAPGMPQLAEYLRPAGERRQMVEHGAHAHAGGPLGSQRMIALGEGGAGDVEVRPRDPGGEVAHEERAHDGSGPALARDVGEVGDVALEPFLVLLEERQPPHALPGRLRVGEQLSGEAVVARQQSRDALAERGHH